MLTKDQRSSLCWWASITPPVSPARRWPLHPLFMLTCVLHTPWMNDVITVTVSYALPLQPLPPNTGISLVARVPGTTVANDAYWADACKAIPANTLFLVLDMGTVRDFFKPTDAGTSYCEMLQSNTKHQWSYDGVDWTTPDFFYLHNRNGGSAAGWPRDKGRDGDARVYLSCWGSDDSWTGGCCSTSTTEYKTYPARPGNGGARDWGQACTYTRPHAHTNTRSAHARTHTHSPQPKICLGTCRMLSTNQTTHLHSSTCCTASTFPSVFPFRH